MLVAGRLRCNLPATVAGQPWKGKIATVVQRLQATKMKRCSNVAEPLIAPGEGFACEASEYILHSMKFEFTM